MISFDLGSAGRRKKFPQSRQALLAGGKPGRRRNAHFPAGAHDPRVHPAGNPDADRNHARLGPPLSRDRRRRRPNCRSGPSPRANLTSSEPRPEHLSSRTTVRDLSSMFAPSTTVHASRPTPRSNPNTRATLHHRQSDNFRHLIAVQLAHRRRSNPQTASSSS